MHTRAGTVHSFPLTFEWDFSQHSESCLEVCEPPQTPPNGRTGAGGGVQMEKGSRSLLLTPSRDALLLSVLYVGIPYNMFFKKAYTLKS